MNDFTSHPGGNEVFARGEQWAGDRLPDMQSVMTGIHLHVAQQVGENGEEHDHRTISLA
jgi:hypothetical protein